MRSLVMHCEDRLTVKEADEVARILRLSPCPHVKSALAKIERCRDFAVKVSSKAYLIANTQGKRARKKLQLAK